MRAKHIRPDLNELPTVEKELGDSYRAANPEGVKRFEAMEHGSFGGARQRLRTPTTLARLESMRVRHALPQRAPLIRLRMALWSA
jgi:hypothetical protein